MRSIPTNIKFVIAIGIACLAIVSLLIFNGGATSPKQTSLNRLNELKQTIASFVETNKRAPASLSELGLPQEKLQDHLGEPFVYIMNERSLTLLSYGSDKKPGGSFFKRDYSVTIDLPPQR